jgi:hypothetical protein
LCFCVSFLSFIFAEDLISERGAVSTNFSMNTVVAESCCAPVAARGEAPNASPVERDAQAPSPPPAEALIITGS